MVTIDLKIESPKIEKNYTIKEIKDFLYFKLKELEKEKLELFKVDYNNLEKKHKKTIDKIKNWDVEDLELIEF